MRCIYTVLANPTDERATSLYMSEPPRLLNTDEQTYRNAVQLSPGFNYHQGSTIIRVQLSPGFNQHQGSISTRVQLAPGFN